MVILFMYILRIRIIKRFGVVPFVDLYIFYLKAPKNMIELNAPTPYILRPIKHIMNGISSLDIYYTSPNFIFFFLHSWKC